VQGDIERHTIGWYRYQYMTESSLLSRVLGEVSGMGDNISGSPGGFHSQDVSGERN